MKDDKRIRRRVRNSYIMSTVSTALVLFLLGSVGYLMFAAMRVADTLRESVQVMVELERDIEPQQRDDIEQMLDDDELVAQVDFTPKEAKAADKEFRKMFEQQEYEEIIGENPLLDSFDLRLTAQSADSTALAGFVAKVKAMKGVAHISYPEMMVARMHSTVNRIRLVLLLFGGALLVISLILLSNTIRLAIYSKRYIINTMKLVGATRGFIMKPFVGSALLHGLAAGATASLLFGCAVYGLNEALPELTSLAEVTKIAAIVAAMLAGGVVLSLAFTVAALNKFINMKSNRIHLY